MNDERIAQPTPWPESPPLDDDSTDLDYWPEPPAAHLFRHWEPGYVALLLDWLAALTDRDVRFDAPAVDDDDDYDFDWEMDCQDARDIELLLDLTGCLDAEVGS